MLRNTRLRLHREIRVGLMEELALTMKISGYPESARLNVLESVVNYLRSRWKGVRGGRCRSTGPGSGRRRRGRRRGG